MFKKILFAVVFFAVLALASAALADVQERSFNWDKGKYTVRLEYDPGSETSYISLRNKQKVFKMPRAARGNIQIQVAPDFFDSGKDAVAFWSYTGKEEPLMSYSVCKFDGKDLRPVMFEEGILRGDLVVDGNVLQLWSGVRMWILYCPGDQSVVKEFPPWISIQNVWGPIGDRIVEFKIVEGEVVLSHPSVLEDGIRIKAGKDLLLLRTDDGFVPEKIEFVGEVVRTIKYPNTSTMVSGSCEVCIMPGDDPLKEKRIKITVVD